MLGKIMTSCIFSLNSGESPSSGLDCVDNMTESPTVGEESSQVPLSNAEYPLHSTLINLSYVSPSCVLCQISWFFLGAFLYQIKHRYLGRIIYHPISYASLAHQINELLYGQTNSITSRRQSINLLKKCGNSSLSIYCICSSHFLLMDCLIFGRWGSGQIIQARQKMGRSNECWLFVPCFCQESAKMCLC